MEKIKEFFIQLLYGGSDMQYENFSFGNSVVTYRMMILAIMLGIIIAATVAFYKRKVPGKMVIALSEAGANSPEKAKTLLELGLSDKKGIINSLSRGTLGRMLYSVEKNGYNEKMKAELAGGKSGKKVKIIAFKPNPTSDRYYIPEDREKAMVKLFSEKGSGIFSYLLTIVLCIVMAAMLFALVPWFLNIIDGAL